MFNNLFNTIAGAATSASYGAPAANGLSGVPLSATFGKFFNSIMSSFSPFGSNNGSQPNLIPQGGGFGGAGFGGANQNAIQAFRNAQNGNPTATLQAQALAPGAVLINPASFTPQGVAPSAAFGGLGGLGGVPLQGFAGQNGIGASGVQGINTANIGGAQFPIEGKFPFYQQNQNGSQQGGFGKLQTLLYPVIGIFTLVKSLFGLRGLKDSMKPVTVNKEDTSYNNYSGYLSEAYVPGNFEDADPYSGDGLGNANSQQNKYF